MTTTQSEKDADATRRTLRWLLGAQIVLAIGLVLIDISPSVPRLFSPSNQPELDAPTQPGDQTRRYSPRNPEHPGPSVDPGLPRRLVTELTQIDDRPTLAVRGAIATGDSERIVAELLETRPQVITLNSPGGSVSDALAIGRAVRDIGADTYLEGTAVCFSACPYIFVGGASRYIEDNARIGVHQHSFGKSSFIPVFLAVEDIQRGQAEVLDHLDAMGIDVRIMGPAMSTPADEIYVLTAEEAKDWNVTTD